MALANTQQPHALKDAINHFREKRRGIRRLPLQLLARQAQLAQIHNVFVRVPWCDQGMMQQLRPEALVDLQPTDGCTMRPLGDIAEPGLVLYDIQCSCSNSTRL
jgi:hypothetical protein